MILPIIIIYLMILLAFNTRDFIEIVINMLHSLCLYLHDLVHLNHQTFGRVCGYESLNTCPHTMIRRPHVASRTPRPQHPQRRDQSSPNDRDRSRTPLRPRGRWFPVVRDQEPISDLIRRMRQANIQPFQTPPQIPRQETPPPNYFNCHQHGSSSNRSRPPNRPPRPLANSNNLMTKHDGTSHI